MYSNISTYQTDGQNNESSGSSKTIFVVIFIAVVIIVLLYVIWSYITNTTNTIKPNSENVIPTEDPLFTSLNTISDICKAENYCDDYQNDNDPKYPAMTQWRIKCLGDADFSTKITGTKGSWKFDPGYDAITFAEYKDLQSAIKPYCDPSHTRFVQQLFTPKTPEGSPPNYNNINDACTKDILCDNYKNNNIPGYGSPQYGIQCTGDDGYYNTIIRTGDEWMFYGGSNDITFAKYPDLKSAIQPYCAYRKQQNDAKKFTYRNAAGIYIDPNDIASTCTAENYCKEYKDTTTASTYSTYDIKCDTDTTFSNKLSGIPGRWIYENGYNNITYATYNDLNAAIKPYCMMRKQDYDRANPPPPTQPPPSTGVFDPNNVNDVCRAENNCSAYKVMNLFGQPYQPQYAVKCVGDQNFTNVVMKDTFNWKFLNSYNDQTRDTTFGVPNNPSKLPTLLSAIKPYCDPGSYRMKSISY